MLDESTTKSTHDHARCIADILDEGQSLLINISHSPSLDADIFLAQILDCDRSLLKAWPDRIVSIAHEAQFFDYIKQRATGKPVAYILGKKGFWTFEVDVNEHTLVPRPETELLVEQALKLIPDDQSYLVADVCTGSGAIAFALGQERPLSKIHATDIDYGALRVARQTLNRLQLRNVLFCDGDLYEPLPEPQYDVIVSNPPYIAENDPYLDHPTMQHEPRHALIAENNGLAIIERLIAEAVNHLKPLGYLLLEHGHEQTEQIRQLAKTHHLHYQLSCQDYQALDRISVLQTVGIRPYSSGHKK